MILNDEYAIRTDASPEHAKAVAQYLDQAIRHVMSAGAVVESHRAVVLAALQVTAELFDARAALEDTTQSIESMSEFVRPHELAHRLDRLRRVFERSSGVEQLRGHLKSREHHRPMGFYDRTCRHHMADRLVQVLRDGLGVLGRRVRPNRIFVVEDRDAGGVLLRRHRSPP